MKKYTNKDRMENLQSKRLARENLHAIDKPRKPVVKSFVLSTDRGQCCVCNLPLLSGQRARWGDEGLHHTSHKQREIKYEICEVCWLAKPCDCP